MVAQPIEPRPPALLTAAARAGVVEPAMGACIIGLSNPRRSSRSVRGHMALSFTILRTIANSGMTVESLDGANFSRLIRFSDAADGAAKIAEA